MAEIPTKLVENPKTVAEHLQNRQRELGISQNEMARRLDVTPETITGWRMHGRQPIISVMPRIIEFLGYNPFALDAKSIGGQIYMYRTENGLNYRELAKATGFDPGTLASWEENMTVPSAENMRKLVIFGILN